MNAIVLTTIDVLRVLENEVPDLLVCIGKGVVTVKWEIYIAI